MGKQVRMGIMACVAAFALAAIERPASAQPARAKILRNVEYAKVGGKRLLLDLYLPAEPQGKVPLVVWIYGGAWRNTWAHDALPSGNAVNVLVGRGCAVASISHRLSQEAIFPAQIHDCKGAVRFLRANAAKYGFDADRIGVWGSSSGGHLAALLGTSGGARELEGSVGGNLGVSSRVQCVADFAGPTDLIALDASSSRFYKPPRLSPPADLVGGPTAQHRDLAIKANPITYVTKDASPFLIVHGESDTLVPISQSQMLVDALKKAGVEVTFEKVKGGGHGGATAAQDERNLRLVSAFFDKHLESAARANTGAPSGAQVVRGALVAKTDRTLDVLPEDEQRPRRIVLAVPGAKIPLKFQQFLAKLAVGSEVKVSQTTDAAGLRGTNVVILALPGKWGKVRGTVTAVINGRLEVQDSQGNKKQYIPRYVPGGDKEMGAAIAQRHAGDRVEIRWFTDDWTRVATMRVLEIGEETAAQPGFEGGTVVGQVVQKGRDFVVIKPDQGEPQRYMPQRVVGEKDELDRDVLKTIAGLTVGDRVEGKWFKDGNRRLYLLKPSGGAPAPAALSAPSVPPPPKPAAQPSSASELVDKVKNAPANTWVEIPKSALMSVAPKPNQFPKTWAVCGPSSVVMAWCGAAFDTRRDRLVIWGGGHADYHGNELYAFDVQKMAWERLTDPFPNPVKDQEVNADGTPNSRHTYGGLAYIAHADRFFALGGSLAGVGFAKCDRTWTYDFDARKWEDRQPGGTLPGGGFCLGCAYDPVSKKLFFGSEHKGLHAYNYDKNTWAKLDGEPVDGLGFAVDIKRKLLVGVGRGRLVLYDIWCRRKGIKPRFGAVGKYGSIAVVERFIRTLKDECTRRIVVPLRRDDMRRELTFHLDWFNEHRPHEALLGRTPNEVHHDRPAENETSRIEVRANWPTGAPCATPVVSIDGEPGRKVELLVSYHAGREHLPVIQLRRVA